MGGKLEIGVNPIAVSPSVMPSLYLIDAHAYLHRAFHALPPLSTSKGLPVNALYGFMRMMIKLMRQYKPDYMAICFDTAAPTFRHESFAAYKATRKEIDTALVGQFPLAREAVAAMNLAAFEHDGFEADDLIAHLTREGRKNGWDVVIVSGDKDALQMVGDGVRVLNESKDILYGPQEVLERYGLKPEQLPDMFALMGDSTDNVPGVPGIGEKTAVKLMQKYQNLENLLKQAPTIEGKLGKLLQDHADDARQSLSLVLLHHDVPLDVVWEKCRLQAPQADKLTTFLQKVEFQALLKDLLPASAARVDTSKRNYRAILSETDLKQWVEAALKAEVVALDTETTGLDPLHSGLVGISMAYQERDARYMPVGHVNDGANAQLPLEVVRRILSPLFNGKKPRLCGHNLKFDIEVLRMHGFEVGDLYFDTMIASYVLNPSRNNHSLKDLALDFLGQPMTPIEQLIGKGAKQMTMDQVPIQEASDYACADADMTFRLRAHLAPELKKKELSGLFYDMEMPLINVLIDMERKGICLDKGYLQKLAYEVREHIVRMEQEIYQLAGEPFNINSPKQLATILFEKLKLPVIRKTKTGISTDEEVLKKLAANHPMPGKLLEYRELQKMDSTYIEGLLAAAKGPESRIHTCFNQTVAATGRLSSSNPNLQNIPVRTELGRRIRQAFVPKQGYELLSADYSQIDLRMLAHMSEDEAMCRAFQKGEDIHTATAAEIFGVSPEKMTKELRRIAKSINFGIVYGISAYGLAQQLGISPDEAQRHITRYFERYPGVKKWIEKTLSEARIHGFVRTLLGRIRYLPEINSSNGAMRGFAERTAMNTPIQGTSADVIKVAMIRLAESAQRDEWSGDMLVQVHDELLFEIPTPHLQAAQAKIKRLMENAIPLRIPVVVDLKAGKNWSEMKVVANR